MTRSTMKHAAQAPLTRRMAWPLVGAVTAAATVVAGWAPVTQAAPSLGAPSPSLKAQAADAGDGTYQSCDAYFGFGKNDNAMDVVSFDVTDENGHDGIAHAVGTDTQVIFQLTNDNGDTLDCVAPEITAQDWQNAMDSVQLFIPSGKSLPTYPGPGHYAYPSVSYNPYISSSNPDVPDFGTVTAVAFKVTSIPDGHTLVSPADTKELVQHYPLGYTDFSTDVDPQVLDYIKTQAGAAASGAFQDALGTCDDNTEFSAALKAAIDVLVAYRGLGNDDHYDCYSVGYLNAGASFLLGLDAARSYVEPIVLKVPVETTTSTSTSMPTTTSTSTSTTSTTKPTSTTSTTSAVKKATVTAPATIPRATAPRPVAARPTYTG